MNNIDSLNSTTISSMLAPAARTETATSTAIDIKDYIGNIEVILNSAAGTGSSPTMDVKIQDSANNSQFADVAGYTFTRVIHTAASLQRLNVDTRKVRRYIQAVATIGGSTPVFTFDMVAIGQKQSQ